MAEAIPQLLPYQQDWIKDRAQVKVIEKSRRIGITWAEAADCALTAGGKSGSDCWYIGYTKEMALEFVETAADWARRLNQVAAAIEETLVQDEGRDILAYRIKFASGHKIVALSSRPTNLRGKQGVAVIDEAAFHDSLDELLKAAIAFTIWGGSVHIISTHNGIDNAFNDLVGAVRAGKLGYSLHKVTFDEALAQGLYRKICEARGIAWTADGEAAWRKEIYDLYGENADEELKCIPRTKGGAWLAWDLILGAEDANAGVPEKFGGGRIFIGNDIGRRRDLWVAWVIEQVGDVAWTREIRELKGATFAAQDAEMDELMLRRYPAARLWMDQTGMGEKPVEDARRRYPGHVEGILFTGAHRLDLASIGKRVFEDRRIRIPRGNSEVRTDLHKPRVEQGPAGTVRLVVERDETGHADRFWALMLALAAADPGRNVPPDIWFGEDDDWIDESDPANAIRTWQRGERIG
jgi:phage FluMu gp28-like protein